MSEFASRVEVSWFFPARYRAAKEFPQIFSGNLEWDLSSFARLLTDTRKFGKLRKSSRKDPVERLYLDGLPIQEVGNGDIIVLDVTHPGDAPVIYLDHEGGDLHGSLLAPNFADYINSLSLLGFVGAEIWQQQAFLEPGRGLNPHSDTASVGEKHSGSRPIKPSRAPLPQLLESPMFLSTSPQACGHGA